MARPKKPVPSYLHHKPSGQAIVVLRAGGRSRTVYLGPYGSPESQAEYERVVAELRTASAGAAAPIVPRSGLSVNEVLVAFWRHAEAYYRRPDGTPTNELGEYRYALRPLKALYGRAFRAPNPFELYYDQSPTSTTLSPERISVVTICTGTLASCRLR